MNKLWDWQYLTPSCGPTYLRFHGMVPLVAALVVTAVATAATRPQQETMTSQCAGLAEELHQVMWGGTRRKGDSEAKHMSYGQYSWLITLNRG
jgi:hypothetical protein